MARRYSAQRYAEAVFEIAMAKKQPDEWQAVLDSMANLSRDASIAAFMESPDIAIGQKAKVIKEALGVEDPLTENFLHLLIQKGRFGTVAEIAGEYRRMLDEQRNIGRADVTTAVPLSEEENKKVTAQLGEILGKKIVARNEVDPEIIGGMVVRVDGKLLDGSVRGRLDNLRAEIGK
jgi:F-type H+-transporting ATPase subunit delta